MGAVLSFCGCRSKETDPEREPLLANDTQPQPAPPVTHESSLNKTIEILAALHSGKLPSQSQLNRLLQLVANSELLNPLSKSIAAQGQGPIGQDTRELVTHTREAIQALISFGTEKNSDNALQELLYEINHSSARPIRVRDDVDYQVIDHLKEIGAEGASAVEKEVPSSKELSIDTHKLFKSLRALSFLLLSSTTLRLLLSDAFLLLREFITRLALDVEEVAQQVQVGAEDVEKAMNVETSGPPMINAMAGEVVDTLHTIVQDINKVTSEPAIKEESARDAFVSRIQELVHRAHQDSQTMRAFRDLLHICRKYGQRYTRAAEAVVSTEADILGEASKQASSSSPDARSSPKTFSREDEEVIHALRNFQALLERLASGHSLEPFLASLADTARKFAAETVDSTLTSTEDTLLPRDPDLQHLLSLVNQWLDSAFAPDQTPDRLYATSRQGTRALERIYDTGRILSISASASPSPASQSSQPEPWVLSLQRTISELGLYIDTLSNDKTTMRVLTSLTAFRTTASNLVSQIFGLGTNAAYARGRTSIRAWKEELLQDLVGWVLPHIIHLLGGFQGMAKFLAPRVEFKMKSPMIEGALDTLTMVVEREGGMNLDLVPDEVVVKTWNEVRVEMENVVDLSSVAPAVVAFPLLLARATSNGSAPPAEVQQHRGMHVSSTNKVHVHVDGIRFGFSDLGYFARFQGGPFGVLGYEDQGLVSVHIGSPDAAPTTRYHGSYGSLSAAGERTHQGLGVDVELSLDTSSRRDGELPSGGEPVFQVDNVNVSLPGATLSAMQFQFDHTRHWILNKIFLQPLAGPIVGKVLQGIMEDQIRNALQGLSNSLGRINEESERRKVEGPRSDVGVEDWLVAAFEEISSLSGVGPSQEEEEGEEIEGDEETETLTKTETTWKGVVHTRTTGPVGNGGEPGTSEQVDEPQQEIAIAIGVGTQIVAGEAGPCDKTSTAISPTAPGLQRVDATAELDHAFDQANAMVQDVKRQGKEATREVNEAVGEARNTVEQAHETWDEAVAREEASNRSKGTDRKRGWRSKAFDI